MPLYTVTSQKALPQETKIAIANHITTTHCRTTGAPPDFVHVMFSNGFKLQKKIELHVLGSIRAGRDASTKDALADAIGTGSAELAGVPTDTVAVVLTDVPAKWVMEGGIVLPEPGSEEDWLKRHRE